jgi:hypothetical protein
MLLTVVIPTLDAADELPATLAALRDEVARAGAVKGLQVPELEIVVSDGGSNDGTATIASGLGARVVAASKGRGSQLRAGAACRRFRRQSSQPRPSRCFQIPSRHRHAMGAPPGGVGRAPLTLARVADRAPGPPHQPLVLRRARRLSGYPRDGRCRDDRAHRPRASARASGCRGDVGGALLGRWLVEASLQRRVVRRAVAGGGAGDAGRTAASLSARQTCRLKRASPVAQRAAFTCSIRRGISSTRLHGRYRESSWKRRISSQPSRHADGDPGSEKI